MQQATLEVQQRDTFGKQHARALRRNGIVPAILYGRAQGTLTIQLDARTFKQFLRTHGENVIIKMEVGGNTETAIIKEIQRHPVEKQALVHADFIRISLDEPVTSTVPIVLEGNPAGVLEGGILEIPLRQVTLHCLPLQLPSDISIDVSGLDIGDAVYVSDLSLDDDIEILDEPERVIALVSQPRMQIEEPVEDEEVEVEGEGEGEEAAEGEEASAEQPVEPEIISRRRSDDDDEDE